MTTHLKHPANCVENPAVRVELFLAFLLDEENDLYRDKVVVRVVAMWYN
jgi:hypothetical protein